MPRQVKYDDTTIFEKVIFSGKVFMYNSPDWDILFPIVDIIRLFKPNTIISHKSGKGQNTIRMYGSQYNHRLLGNIIINKNDYSTSLQMVKCIFIFTDNSDPIVLNLMNTAKKNNIPIVCYSTLDSVYHCYSGESKQILNDPKEVIDFMYSLFDLAEIKKIADLFPEFEIIENVPESPNILDKCHEKLKEITQQEKKKKDLNNIKLFDPNLARIKKMEKDRTKVEYEDDLEQINKKMNSNFISKFFKKK